MVAARRRWCSGVAADRAPSACVDEAAAESPPGASWVDRNRARCRERWKGRSHRSEPPLERGRPRSPRRRRPPAVPVADPPAAVSRRRPAAAMAVRPAVESERSSAVAGREGEEGGRCCRPAPHRCAAAVVGSLAGAAGSWIGGDRGRGCAPAAIAVRRGALRGAPDRAPRSVTRARRPRGRSRAARSDRRRASGLTPRRPVARAAGSTRRRAATRSGRCRTGARGCGSSGAPPRPALHAGRPRLDHGARRPVSSRMGDLCAPARLRVCPISRAAQMEIGIAPSRAPEWLVALGGEATRTPESAPRRAVPAHPEG